VTFNWNILKRDLFHYDAYGATVGGRMYCDSDWIRDHQVLHDEHHRLISWTLGQTLENIDSLQQAKELCICARLNIRWVFGREHFRNGPSQWVPSAEFQYSVGQRGGSINIAYSPDNSYCHQQCGVLKSSYARNRSFRPTLTVEASKINDQWWLWKVWTQRTIFWACS
jgi:hypothetical protein